MRSNSKADGKVDEDEENITVTLSISSMEQYLSVDSRSTSSHRERSSGMLESLNISGIVGSSAGSSVLAGLQQRPSENKFRILRHQSDTLHGRKHAQLSGSTKQNGKIAHNITGIGSLNEKWGSETSNHPHSKRSLRNDFSDGDEFRSSNFGSLFLAKSSVSDCDARNSNSRSGSVRGEEGSFVRTASSRLFALKKRGDRPEKLHPSVSQVVTSRGNLHPLGVYSFDESAYLSDEEESKKQRKKEKSQTKRREIKYESPVETVKEAYCTKVIDGNNILVEWTPVELPQELTNILDSCHEKRRRNLGSTVEQYRMAEMGYFFMQNGMVTRRMRVRMRSTFAPRRRQNFAKRAKRALEALVLKQWVEVRIYGIDAQCRALADCYRCSDKGDIQKALIKNGYAWLYIGVVQDLHLAHMQKEARRNKAGLWEEEDPTPPWVCKV